MLLKLFFGLLIAAGVLLMLRARFAPPRRERADAAAAGFQPTPRQIAYGLVAVLAVTSVGVSFLHWQGTQEVVTVRVVNTRSGETTTYQAHRSDIGPRSFRTLDGRRVTVAEVDRVEIQEP
jgi:hypothetical protein